ncbi:hypothetical protein [Ammoniphilus sp. 3BR4]|uniref:hypothetical protein n=1 Tax=Ammoniphilus sp. 3BR4 TaxID=3158265 RepID=UPI0034669B9F
MANGHQYDYVAGKKRHFYLSSIMDVFDRSDVIRMPLYKQQNNPFYAYSYWI